MPDRHDDAPFRDAEAWLAERGVEREPIRVVPPPPPEPAPPPDRATRPGSAPGPGPDAGPGTVAHPDRAAVPDTTAPVTAREAQRLAADAADEAVRRADEAATTDPATRQLGDDVAEAVAFVRRSTASAPQSEARVRAKLADRGWGDAVVDRAMERARRERLVDDAAMAAALVDERRAKGHAPARIRRDLRARGFDDDTLDAALASADAEDLEAAAFAVATDKAARVTGLDAEAAFRRVAAHVARRGYPDGLARKVAREAVFTARDAERTAGH